MARDILREFGPDSPSNQQARARSGGVTMAKKLPYDPPMGPVGIMGNERPGLGGNNYGNCGTQGPHDASPSESGSPGNHGEGHGHGTNRG